MRDKRLPITDHLLELRRRLTWAAAAVAICTGAAFAFHEQILTLLMAPAQGFTDIPNQKPIYTDITEYLGIAAKVSLLVGLFALDVLARPEDVTATVSSWCTIRRQLKG